MPVPPRPVRPLPGAPAQDTESGAQTGLATRIVIVATIVLGQLFALTVALDAYLLDHELQAWLLAGFSLISFAVVLAPFEPVPLEGVLSSSGFAYEVEQLDGGDWRVSFTRAA